MYGVVKSYKEWKLLQLLCYSGMCCRTYI